MNDTLEPIPDDEQQLAVQGTTQPGSLLRLRDVQALNRSFRRLAEVQEALLDRLEALEQEKAATSRFNGPLMAMGGVAIGLSVAVLAYVLWQDKTPLVIPAAAMPEITVSAPEVTVAAADNTELVQAMSEMNANIASVLQTQREDRQQLGELTAKLLLSEEEKNQLMREFALAEEHYQEGLAVAAKASAERAAKAPTLLTPPTSSAGSLSASNFVDPDALFVQAINGVLSADGYGSLRLQAGVLGADETSLTNVTWMSWGRDGLAETVIRAARLELELHQMTRTMVLRFYAGHRIAEGLRTPLPEAGLRLDLEDVSTAAWIKLFPGLVNTAAPVLVAGGASGAPLETEVPPNLATAPALGSVQAVRKALDDLISHRGSFSYYRLNALGSMEGGLLKMVQINWHDNSGRLVKTIEADSLAVILHAGGSVELLLRNGAFLDGGVKSPFSADRFRLHLPSQDLDSWRNSGVPYTESDS
jgi:hypothetical protein